MIFRPFLCDLTKLHCYPSSAKATSEAVQSLILVLASVCLSHGNSRDVRIRTILFHYLLFCYSGCLQIMSATLIWFNDNDRVCVSELDSVTVVVDCFLQLGCHARTYQSILFISMVYCKYRLAYLANKMFKYHVLS